MKKAQGLSMNVIIVAAIALLVLVVLVAIFSGRMSIFNRDTDQIDSDTRKTCVANGGGCYAENPGEGFTMIEGTCGLDGQQCYKRS